MNTVHIMCNDNMYCVHTYMAIYIFFCCRDEPGLGGEKKKKKKAKKPLDKDATKSDDAETGNY